MITLSKHESNSFCHTPLWSVLSLVNRMMIWHSHILSFWSNFSHVSYKRYNCDKRKFSFGRTHVSRWFNSIFNARWNLTWIDSLWKINNNSWNWMLNFWRRNSRSMGKFLKAYAINIFLKLQTIISIATISSLYFCSHLDPLFTFSPPLIYPSPAPHQCSPDMPVGPLGCISLIKRPPKGDSVICWCLQGFAPNYFNKTHLSLCQSPRSDNAHIHGNWHTKFSSRTPAIRLIVA